MRSSTNPNRSPARVGRMKMRRCTSTISPGSGPRSWKSQVLKRLTASTRLPLRNRHLPDQMLRHVGAVGAADVGGRGETVPDDAGEHGLDVFGDDVPAAFHQRPCTGGVEEG